MNNLKCATPKTQSKQRVDLLQDVLHILEENGPPSEEAQGFLLEGFGV